jgi:ATP-dependent DNA helicase HFM1/MER3
MITELAVSGIGIHHAGLTMDDRRAIEDLYLKQVLKVVIATTVSPFVFLGFAMITSLGYRLWLLV